MMEVTRAYKFRIYPDATRQAEIDERLVLAQQFYNKILEKSITSYKNGNTKVSMAQFNRFAKEIIQNASWNRFINMLSYKAESAGMKVIKVDPRNTSKECSNCGNIREIPLSIREYNCSICGMWLGRDINASINILHKATTLGQRGSHAQGDMASAIQQASKSRIEELGTDKTHPLQDAVIA